MRRISREVREMIETMWVEGMTMREINEAVGHGINISAARRRGWNLPYRYCGCNPGNADRSSR